MISDTVLGFSSGGELRWRARCLVAGVCVEGGEDASVLVHAGGPAAYCLCVCLSVCPLQLEWCAHGFPATFCSEGRFCLYACGCRVHQVQPLDKRSA